MSAPPWPLPELLERLLDDARSLRAGARPPPRCGARRPRPSARSRPTSLGSSWVRVPGTAGGPSLAVVGHIDEIGVVVTHLGDDGIAAVRPVGGFDPHVLVGQRVDVLARGRAAARRRSWPRAEAAPRPRRGAQAARVRGSLPRRRREGRRRAQDARASRRRGRAGTARRSRWPATASPRARSTTGSAVTSRSRRRDGWRRRGGGPGDVIAVAAVQEEVGDFAGSRTAAFGIEPRGRDRGRRDARERRPRRRPGGRGEGRARRRADARRAGRRIHPAVFELLHETAEAEEIPFAVEVSRGTTSTDADAVYLSRRGVATGLVSVPLRYMHSPVETRRPRGHRGGAPAVVAFALQARARTRASRG